MPQSATPDLTPLPQSPVKTRGFRTLRAISALVMREIAATDSRTSLGFLWALIEPVATITLLTVIFSLLTHAPPLGTNFPLFYVTGVLPFQAYAMVGNKVAGSVRFSKPLLGLPSVTALDAVLARFLLNFLLTLAVFPIVTYSIIWWYELRLIVDLPKVALSMTLAGMLALGVGTFNAVIFLAFPTYENIWAILTRPMLIISGVLFLIDSLPRFYADILWWNPVAHPIVIMRGAFYPGYDDSVASPLYVICFSIVAFTIGLVTLHRFVRDALDT